MCLQEKYLIHKDTPTKQAGIYTFDGDKSC